MTPAERAAIRAKDNQLDADPYMLCEENADRRELLDDIEGLVKTIKEYDQAYNDVIIFTRAYIASGGDQHTPPERWNELDNLRQIKYAAMLTAAGITQ